MRIGFELGKPNGTLWGLAERAAHSWVCAVSLSIPVCRSRGGKLCTVKDMDYNLKQLSARGSQNFQDQI